MDRKSRIAYLMVTTAVFISAFIIYGLLSSVQPTVANSEVKTFLLFGCLGGLGFSMFLSMIILAVRFFLKKSLKFKVIAAFLWPVTLGCIFYVGVLSYIPYQIYNIVKIIKDK